METLRQCYHFLADAGSAVLLALSIGAGASILGASVTHTLRGGIVAGVLGTLIGGAGFGYAIWRTYRPTNRNGRAAA